MVISSSVEFVPTLALDRLPHPEVEQVASAISQRRRGKIAKERKRTAFFRGLTYGLLLNAFLLVFLTILLPTIRGAVPLTVLSNSMAPAMPVGSLAIVLPTKPTVPDADLVVLTPQEVQQLNDVSEVELGDVIVFQPNPGDPMLVMHRVRNIATTVHAGTGQMQTTFTTRGDNLAQDDAPVEDFMVRGRVLYSLPLLGYVNNLLNTGPRAYLAIIIVAVVGYALTIFYLARAAGMGRKPKLA